MYLMIIGIFFTGLGLSFIAINSISDNKKIYDKCTLNTTAGFYSVIKKHDVGSDNRYSYIPTYKYIIDNKEYHYQGFGKAKEEDINKNTINIKYNPENPNESYNEEDKISSDKVHKLFKILGIIFIGIGIIPILIKLCI